MKNFLSSFFIFLLVILISLILALSTIGIETNKFNNIISKKINQSNNNVILKLTSIKFKLDIKVISLFLETNNPKIEYRNVLIPAKNIKVYIDFLSLAKSEPKIKKINLVLNQLNIVQLKKLSTSFKPSNFTSFIKNKISEGKLNTEIEIYFNNNLFNDFIARGSVSDLKAKITNNISLDKINFSFFADKSDVLVKNIYGESGPIKIINGDLKVKLASIISLKSNFRTNLKYSSKFINYLDLIKKFEYGKNITNLEADLNNSFSIDFDQTYKVQKYNFNINGKINKVDFDFKNALQNSFVNQKINQLSLIESKIQTTFEPNKNSVNISGKYSLNKKKPLIFDITNINNKELLKLSLNAEYDQPIELGLINYKKPKDIVANIFLNLNKKKDIFTINEIKFTERNNIISAEKIKFNKDNFLKLKKISVKTNNNGNNNNNFTILYNKKILIDGTQFDASNLPKFLNSKKNTNNFININKDIEINFANITAPLSEKLKNFKLLGKIEKGKFIKISSKGDFGDGNFLDITMKKDKNNKKKYLEVYSDLTKPLLTEYSFFNGLTGGKLLYTSIIDGDNSNSKLKIENFNVINAPGVVKLLSLADLGGLADLAEGDGLSFDILEITIEKNKNLLKLNEIIALGPSISVLMEGYQDSNVTSIRGTLVPAKTLNKMISKIPVLGNIIIPKEVGEGLFGISFKIKGPPGKVKTTINPIRTITPRFIQKIIDRNKNSKSF